MKEYTINYTVDIEGEICEHTETRQAFDERDAIGQVHYAWFPAKVSVKLIKEER